MGKRIAWLEEVKTIITALHRNFVIATVYQQEFALLKN